MAPARPSPDVKKKVLPATRLCASRVVSVVVAAGGGVTETGATTATIVGGSNVLRRCETLKVVSIVVVTKDSV